MAGPMTSQKGPVQTADCYLCGGWPAARYMDISQKSTSPRICETCIQSGLVVLKDGVWVTNPERPADPEGSAR